MDVTRIIKFVCEKFMDIALVKRQLSTYHKMKLSEIDFGKIFLMSLGPK